MTKNEQFFKIGFLFKVLVQKLRRTNFIARLWLSSTEPHPPGDLPEEFGWKLQDGSYKINWFSGDTTPSMLDVTLSEEQEDIEGKILSHSSRQTWTHGHR